ncbi:ABC transporter permease [Cellvibrio japonicus]|uniref:Transport permease protein n=1 Tax=Cellvibrio japonicus (strain Ueda107) TaxID=498211 RepID=B3PFY5_CELJU|nr:ABC transporter permease [Cellvibrio japonicus]ACE84723.1 Wzm [Cellvibrio japonicus Ueda107]QEI13674.1 ABC transporter [Cellvibrio japonicus]QEI17248.1 ABC transporter [Cellvibrio japonicus]QEI20825.1 ABC transporter [Cellvibrio japonicus]
MKIRDFIILVDTKAKMNLKAEASRLYLSFLWWLLEPILFVLAFYFVFNILLKSGHEDYLLFLMCAKIPYMWFSKAVTSASGSIVANRGIISQIDIPKTIFPYASIQISLYKEIPVFILLFGMCIGYGYMPSTEWLWLIPLFFVQYLFIVAASLVTALMVCYADDVRMFISMLMLFLMFISGIFFDISNIQQPLRDYLILYNPLAFLCDSFRKILMHKGMYAIEHLIGLIVFFSIAIGSLHLVYRSLSRNIASKVVNA